MKLVMMDLCSIGSVVVIVFCITTSLQDISVPVSPRNATVSFRGSISLNCIFSEDVSKCLWMRNETAVKIKDRYKFIYNTKGINTSDCSIEITEIENIDATYWYCSCPSLSNDHLQPCKSNYAFLTLDDRSTTTEPPTIPTHTSSSDATTNDNSPTSAPYFSMTNILLYVVIGLLLWVGAVILFAVVIFHHINKAKKVAAVRKLSTSNMLRRTSDPALHEYTYITTEEGPSQQDSMGYLIPKNVLMDNPNQEKNPLHHIYEEIPETVVQNQ